jgi:hypothetical protein
MVDEATGFDIALLWQAVIRPGRENHMPRKYQSTCDFTGKCPAFTEACKILSKPRPMGSVAASLVD